MHYSSQDIINLTEDYCAHNYHPLDIVLAKAKGVWVWDVEGNRYLDMLSAYSAMNFGHGNKRLINAAKKQLKRMTLSSRAFFNDQLGLLAEGLCKLAKKDMMLPMVSGAEAVETAIKAVRRWGYEVKGVEADKAEIICFAGNFAGRTTTIISFSDVSQYQRDFGPFTPGFKIAKFGDIDSVKALVSKNTVGILFEPIQGEGGINVPPKGFIKELRELCDSEKFLMIADEIQTGLCRTGKIFACEHEGIVPDIYIIGKSLGGGITPISAVLANKDVLGLFEPGSHGSTFGGNSLACAIAREVIDLINEEEPHENAQRLGNWLIKKLISIKSPAIKEVRGKGLMIRVEINPEFGTAWDYCQKLKKLGVLCKDTRTQVMRLAPPLVIKKKELQYALQKITSLF
ncbi:MAG: ornithine--oxo-acid transaminase [SAR324 cluster bacterium]|uniref:ornithine aminotransferase n=1 Tax=SAR324 cluster bacterium TaxID=2024889 RepID=A0A7X9IJI1_9DELT|nr:ornithine--oxo-acid transaminase [SAR324 cluster bacterium]